MVAEADATTTDTQESDIREHPLEPTDQSQIATAHSEDANRSISKAMPKWIPAIQNGKATRVKLTFLITFKCE